MENNPSPPPPSHPVRHWLGWIAGSAALAAIVVAPQVTEIFPAAGLLWSAHVLLVSAYVWLLLILFGGPMIWAARFDRSEARLRKMEEIPPDWSPMPEPGGPRSVVVLVHGTFATHAPWTLPGARLPLALAERSSVVPFAWSGANSMQARRIAVQRLREHVRRLVEAGYGPVSLVGHSHAGNIILKACEDPGTAENVRALVCLSTPFISAWRPPVSRLAGSVARTGIAMVPLVLVFPILMIGAAYPGIVTRPESMLSWTLLVSTLVPAFVVVVAGLRIGLRFRLESDAADVDIDGSVCQADAIASLAPRTLIVSRAGDEADGVLKLASAVNRFMLKRYALSETIDDRITYQRIRKTGMQGMITVVASVASLAFGANGLKHPTGTYLASSETPPGTWTHQMLGVDTAMTDLYHSSLYNDERVVATVLGWIEALAGLGGAESAANVAPGMQPSALPGGIDEPKLRL